EGSGDVWAECSRAEGHPDLRLQAFVLPRLVCGKARLGALSPQPHGGYAGGRWSRCARRAPLIPRLRAGLPLASPQKLWMIGAMRIAALLLLLLQPLAAQAKVDFEKQIAPILVSRCIECHGPKEQKGDLRLDARAFAFLEGDEDYWSIIAGQPDSSELMHRLGLPLGDDDIMPAKGEPLSKEQQGLF